MTHTMSTMSSRGNAAAWGAQMRWHRFFVLLILSGFTLVAGCSGMKTVGPPPLPANVQVSLTLTDTPPVGVTVVSFSATIIGAALNPRGSLEASVALVSTPTKIEIKQLETEAAFLATASVPPGTYNSITVAFANPELTFKNDTASRLVGCNPAQVCQIKPLAAGSITFVSAPFPVTIIGNTPTGFTVDVNLANLITGTLGVNFTVANALTVLQLPLPGQPVGQLQEIEGLIGVVASKGATLNQFTLQTVKGNFTATVDSSTVFDAFVTCPAANFTCVQNLQVVEADLKLLASGLFVARRIEFEDNAADDELEGIVTSVDTLTQFKMVVVDQLRAVSGVAVGNPVTVSLQTNPSFQVDTLGLTVPSGLLGSFQGAIDTSQLMPGQNVLVRVRSLTGSLPQPIVVSTDRVRLRVSRFTASVGSVTPPTLFDVNNLPQLFQTALVTQVQALVVPQTRFDGVTDINSLAAGNTVSLRGLLFTAPPNTVLIADKVRKR